MLFDLENVWTETHDKALEEICQKFDPAQRMDFVVERTRNDLGFSDEEWAFLFDLYRARIRRSAKAGLIAHAVESLTSQLLDLTEDETVSIILEVQEPIREALWRRSEENAENRLGELLGRLDHAHSEKCEKLGDVAVEAEDYASGLASCRRYEIFNLEAALESDRSNREARHRSPTEIVSEVNAASS